MKLVRLVYILTDEPTKHKANKRHPAKDNTGNCKGTKSINQLYSRGGYKLTLLLYQHCKS